MWSAGALGSAMALVAAAAVAAPGDSLVVTSDVVNVRAGPGTENPVLFHAARDQQVVELTRTGNWVQVEIPDEAADGWIHQSLLQVIERAQPAPDGAAGTVDARAAPSRSDALALFRSQVAEFNARAVAAAGVELFAGAEPADGGTVRVIVTEAWDLVPEAGQQSYTNALFDRWRAAAGDSEPLRVQVVGPDGTVVSEKSGPATP